jgi:hypothetical protein
MNHRDARRHALSEWLMEFSALWAVFPVLDQLIEGGRIWSALTVSSLVINVGALVGGILLRKGESR